MSQPNISDLSYYPFLVDFNEFLKREIGEGIDISVLVETPYMDDAYRRVKKLLIDREVFDLDSIDRVTRVVTFYLGIMLTASTGQRRFLDEYISREIGLAMDRFRRSSISEALAILKGVGIDVEEKSDNMVCFRYVNTRRRMISERCLNISLRFLDLVKEKTISQRNLLDFLVESSLYRGRVYTERSKLDKLIYDIFLGKAREAVSKLVESDIANDVFNSIKKYRDRLLYEYIVVNRDVLATRPKIDWFRLARITAKELEIASKYSNRSVGVNDLPPCIARSIERIGEVNSSDMLWHIYVYLALTFLVSIGLNRDQIIKLLNTNNELLLRKIDFLLEKREKNDLYLPPPCNIIRNLGLCDDCSFKNPISRYISESLRRGYGSDSGVS